MKVHYHIFTALFMTALGVYSMLNGYQTFQKQGDTKSLLTGTEEISYGSFWNEVSGISNQMLGKKADITFDFVKDKEGFLYSANFWNISDEDPFELALRVRRLQDEVKDKKTKVLFVLYPTKYNEIWSDGYYGIPYNNMNRTADKFLLYLRRFNVDYLDFREIYIEENRTIESVFNHTDHQLTIPASFECFQRLTGYLNSNDKAGLDPDYFYRDRLYYKEDLYEKRYAGYLGRDAGAVSGGLEDYTVIYPKFHTDYQYFYQISKEQQGTRSGTILDTLISQDAKVLMDNNISERSSVYLQSGALYERIVNNKNPQGIKVLFLRDIYSSAMNVFFSTLCREEILIRTDAYEGSRIEEFVENDNYDYIIVVLSADNLMSQDIPFYPEK